MMSMVQTIFHQVSEVLHL